MINKNVPVL